MSTYWIIVTLAFAILKPITCQETNGSTYCEFYNGKGCSNSEQGCQQREKCILDDPAARNHCYVMWHYDSSTNKTTIKRKGCFLNGKECYDKTECVDRSEGRKKNIFFCCCSGDMCNQKFAWLPKTAEIINSTTEVTETEVTLQEDEEKFKMVIFSISVPTIVLIVIALIVWCIKCRSAKRINALKGQPDSTASPTHCLDPIQLLELKARGHFGAVWKASMGNNIVAAKVFPSNQVQSWQTEQAVFRLPHMKHPDLLEFIGAEKREGNLQTELWLVTAYHENGSLHDYLKANELSWPQLCKIARSMLRGLMHLHEDFPGDKMTDRKPVIAHRDLKSHNILLKADMTACIADFGLSLIFHPDKLTGNTHGQVGTRRYMAPEVLQGAINFNPDSFLRIDMYACGLVLWELASRCELPDVETGNYKLPFEDEVGHNPSLDDMLKIVVHKGHRPQILPSWRNHPELVVLCEIMEECWDEDPEARLSVSCVLERVVTFTGSQMRHTSKSIWIGKDNNSSIRHKKSNCQNV